MVAGGRIRWDRSVAIAVALLVMVLAVCAFVWAWEFRTLEIWGLTNRWSEALLSGAGGWQWRGSWRWVVLGFLVLVTVDRAHRPLRRAVLWGTTAAIVVQRVVTFHFFGFDPQQPVWGPVPWWRIEFAVPVVCLLAAAVALGLRARTEAAVLTAAALVLFADRPHAADPVARFEQLPITGAPAMSVGAVGLVLAALLWLLLSRGRPSTVAVGLAAVAAAALVLDVGFVLSPIAAVQADWAFVLVDEVRSLGLLVAVLVALPLLTRTCRSAGRK